MSKIVCAPAALLPAIITSGVDYFALYSNPGRPGVGTIASEWPRDLKRQGFAPPVRVWDFVTLALSIAAADLSSPRAKSPDGWTRVLELDIYLCDPEPWLGQREALENALRLLTGDFWTLNLLSDGEPPPRAVVRSFKEADCVSLLSGGIDSLVGAIDLSARGRKPLFVSQIAEKAETQRQYARAVGAQSRHLQWNHRIHPVHPSERSTRGRSIVFFAFAALAATTVDIAKGLPVELYIPENGFISLNVPLNPGRMGTFSTKTAHPAFLHQLQAIWSEVGINTILTNPYQYTTKGELLSACRDQPTLRRVVGESVSCGRFRTFKHSHCGRCVPCLVRRAAFLRAGIPDSTPRYYFDDLRVSGRDSGANDIGAVAAAYLRYKDQGVRMFTGGALSFAQYSIRPHYEGVVQRGMEELGRLLKERRIL
jgi:hypothetical protein